MVRNRVLKQTARKRIKNFFEVALGYSDKGAFEEAKRCLQCNGAPCRKGCPVEIDIPAFIKLIKEGRITDALLKVKEKNNLPAVAGRVCPQENQCEVLCALNKKNAPINIGALERYAADYELKQGSPPAAGQAGYRVQGSVKTENLTKVAVAGSGPCGLTCSADLAKMGYKVTLFESLHLAGGVLTYGIPEFRLPKKIVQDEIDYIKAQGVQIKTDILIGKTFTIEDLFKDGFKAVFIATGAGLPQFLGIPGENSLRVYSANEFLTRVNLMKAYKFPKYATPLSLGKTVSVIGGGNVAIDCARVALRLNKKAVLVYRRTEKEMPARGEEIKNAKEEGVIFKLRTQPVRVLADSQGFVKGLECLKMKLGPPDESGRRRGVPQGGLNFILKTDTVIVAIGQNPNPLLPKATNGLKMTHSAAIWVDSNYMTSIRGVFAGGDIVSGADTVIRAMGAGKKAAAAIDRYINQHIADSV